MNNLRRQPIEKYGSALETAARDKAALLLHFGWKATLSAHEQWSKKMAEGGEEEVDRCK